MYVKIDRAAEILKVKPEIARILLNHFNAKSREATRSKSAKGVAPKEYLENDIRAIAALKIL